MKKNILSPLIATIMVAALSPLGAAMKSQNDIKPPEPMREFRGAWVASVANIDWPSKKGLSTEQQKQEFVEILDRAAALKLNAIIFQVRPVCDALYASKHEPWSEYLSGTMGKAPDPYYDPLEFAIEEAHKRGIELHAWFNPYRARVLASTSPVSADHISKTRPELVRKYGKFLWLDPGEPDVQQHSLNVIMDVVRRYNVDGIHFDDYFYPYQEHDANGRLMDFPDEPSWTRYKESGGKLSKNDWRRESVNTFIENCYKSIKAEKPWVQFGISPFGIWKSGVPPSIRGLNAYESLYADSRKWLAEGWLDYFAPQLYWNIDAKEQSYPVLLKWWAEQNIQKRHLWPGISTARVGSTRGPEEIVNQIILTRSQPGAEGNIHWNFKSLARNTRGVADMVSNQLYTEPALVPASGWLHNTPPKKPVLSGRTTQRKNTTLRWQPASKEKAWQWVLQKQVGETWTTEILPSAHTSCLIQNGDPDTKVRLVVLRSVDRFGQLSEPAIYKLK